MASTQHMTSIATSTCVHHWLIATADGPESEATCARCGAKRMFSNTPTWGWSERSAVAGGGAGYGSGVRSSRREEIRLSDE